MALRAPTDTAKTDKLHKLIKEMAKVYIVKITTTTTTTTTTIIIITNINIF